MTTTVTFCNVRLVAPSFQNNLMLTTMKKALFLLFLMLGTLTANAQFAKGTKYVGASVSGLGLSYSSEQKFRFGLDATAGYFMADCLMLRGNVSYDHVPDQNNLSVGGSARYYFDQCGVFMGAGIEFVHYSPKSNDVQIPVEVGYAFFLNRYLTIEPSVYYKMSLDSFSNKSSVGLRIGLGYYF